MSTATVTQIVHLPTFGLIAEYDGGQYVNLKDSRNGEILDVVNVFDYATGEPRIGTDYAEVKRAAEEYLRGE